MSRMNHALFAGAAGCAEVDGAADCCAGAEAQQAASNTVARMRDFMTGSIACEPAPRRESAIGKNLPNYFAAGVTFSA